MTKRLLDLCRDDDAATTVEYAVLLALILMGVISAIGVVGSQTGGLWGGIDSDLSATRFGNPGGVTVHSRPDNLATFTKDPVPGIGSFFVPRSEPIPSRWEAGHGLVGARLSMLAQRMTVAVVAASVTPNGDGQGRAVDLQHSHSTRGGRGGWAWPSPHAVSRSSEPLPDGNRRTVPGRIGRC